MKRKLLTVLLAVVMVFGVFGLTACSKSNPDADYNYYGVKYEIEDEVNIQAATFQGIYKMFTTAGKFVVYVATEDTTSGGSKADFQAVNKLAADWGITIYHFNPELSGGYARGNVNAQTTNIIEELDAVAAASQLATVQATLSAISKVEATEWVDNSIIAINGAESTVSGGAVSYKGSIQQFANGLKDPAAGYSSANVKYEKFHSVANGARAIASVSTRKPSFGAYTEAERDYPIVPEAFNSADTIKTMNLFGDNRLHMYNDDNGTDALLDEKEDVFVTVANFAMFAHLMDNNEGYFSVFFGGTWCGNTQAIVFATNDLAKDYGISKIYFFDPRLEDGTKIDAVKDGAIVENSAYLASSLNTRTADGAGAAYNFNFLYGKFLSEYLNTYKSEWNITEGDNATERFIKITVDGQKQDFTRMCVPNIMMFNGEAEGKAELVALAEAEYTYANVKTEGDPQQIEWYAAVSKVFEANPYAVYAPVVVVEEVAPEAGSGSAGSGSAGGSAGGSGDAC